VGFLRVVQSPAIFTGALEHLVGGALGLSRIQPTTLLPLPEGWAASATLGPLELRPAFTRA